MSRRRTASGWPICPHLHTGHNTSAVIAVVIAMGPCVHLRAKTRLPAAGQWPSAVLTGISDQQQLDQIVVLSIQPASSRRWHAGRSRTAEPKRLRRKGPRRGRRRLCCCCEHTTQRCWRSSRRRGWQDHTYPVPVQRNLGEPRTRDTHVSGTCIIREQHGEQGIPSDQHKGTSIVGFLWLVRISRLGTQGREQRPRGRGLDGGCHRSTPRIGHTTRARRARARRGILQVH